MPKSLQNNINCIPMFAKDKRHQFSEIIIKEVNNKAPLYGIMGGIINIVKKCKICQQLLTCRA